MAVEPQGNPPPKDGQGTDPPAGSDQQPKYVTAADVEGLVNKALNGALTKRNGELEKRFEKTLAEREQKLTEAITTAIAERFTALDEKLAAIKPKEDEKPKPDVQAPPPPKLEETPAYKALQKKLEALEKANIEAEQRRVQADQQRRDVQLRSTLTSELAKLGLTGERGDLALGYLVDARKLVGFRPDSDDIVYRNGDEEVPLADGLKAWSGTEYAKALIPPKGIQGSGEIPGGGGAGGNNRNNSTGLGDLLLNHFKQGI